MRNTSAFQVRFAYWPVRMCHRLKNGHMDFTGFYAWWGKVYMVKNLNHGWVAFVEDQTEEKLATCPSCGSCIKEIK